MFKKFRLSWAGKSPNKSSVVKQDPFICLLNQIRKIKTLAPSKLP